MNHYVKLALTVFFTVIVANFVLSKIIAYLYISDTDLAIQQSRDFIDQYEKQNQDYIQSLEQRNVKIKNDLAQERMNKLILESQLESAQFRLNNDHYQQNTNQNYAFNSSSSNRDKQSLKEKRERNALKREKERIKRKNKQADLEHIRKENIKTCKHWQEQYNNNPTAKNKSFKESSCSRAYGY